MSRRRRRGRIVMPEKFLSARRPRAQFACVAVAACCLILAGFAAPLAAENPIRVMTFPNEPFFYQNADGEPEGYEYRILRSFAESEGRPLEVIWTKHAQTMFSGLAEGSHDLVAATITITEERRMKMAFSKPYFPVLVLLVEKRGQESSRLEDIAGKRVACWAGSLMANLLEDLDAELVYRDRENPEWQETTSMSERLFRLVERGNAEALAIDSAMYLMHAERYPDLAPSLPLADPSFYGFVMSLDSPLQGALDAHIERLRETGALAELLVEAYRPWAQGAMEEMVAGFADALRAGD